MIRGWGMNSWDWVLMSLMMLIGTALVVLLVVAVVRGSVAFGPPRHPDNPLDILAQRFARGEIDEVGYQRRQSVLQR